MPIEIQGLTFWSIFYHKLGVALKVTCFVSFFSHENYRISKMTFRLRRIQYCWFFLKKKITNQDFKDDFGMDVLIFPKTGIIIFFPLNFLTG